MFANEGGRGNLQDAVRQAQSAGRREDCLARLGTGVALDRIGELLTEEVSGLGLIASDKASIKRTINTVMTLAENIRDISFERSKVGFK